MDAVITAGGRISGEFAMRAGVTVKALIEIAGKPVIRTVVEALRGVPEVERILVVGPEEEMSRALGGSVDEIIPESANGAENLLIGLEHCSIQASDRAIFAASDLPFVTTDAIRVFLAACPPEADFCYPILTRERFLSAYPGLKTRFAPLRGGWYTGGCVFLLKPAALLAQRPLIDRIFNARKSVLKLAAILGWGFILQILTLRASVETCARRGSELAGCDCRAVPDSPPELAFDLDKLGEYEYALRHAVSVSRV